jgi:hypothetical protein
MYTLRRTSPNERWSFNSRISGVKKPVGKSISMSLQCYTKWLGVCVNTEKNERTVILQLAHQRREETGRKVDLSVTVSVCVVAEKKESD